MDKKKVLLTTVLLSGGILYSQGVKADTSSESAIYTSNKTVEVDRQFQDELASSNTDTYILPLSDTRLSNPIESLVKSESIKNSEAFINLPQGTVEETTTITDKVIEQESDPNKDKVVTPTPVEEKKIEPSLKKEETNQPLSNKEVVSQPKPVEEKVVQSNTSFPIEGQYYISSGFGVYREVTLANGQYYTDVHNGVDFVGSPGAAIKAWKSGIVVFSSPDSAGGEGIIIQHPDGLYSYYWHFRPGTRAVSVGQEVVAGQYLGVQGMSGYATGEHLHFGVSTALWDGYIDPLSVL